MLLENQRHEQGLKAEKELDGHRLESKTNWQRVEVDCLRKLKDLEVDLTKVLVARERAADKIVRIGIDGGRKSTERQAKHDGPRCGGKLKRNIFG